MRTYNGIERPDFTPDYITELKADEVFVFGSNLAGMHGGGAAYVAFRQFGAVMGCGVGLRGQSYAIPTMQGGVETIEPYVTEFIAFAKAHPELFFYVTRIGCGIAGFRDKEIAPLFADAIDVDNISAGLTAIPVNFNSTQSFSVPAGGYKVYYKGEPSSDLLEGDVNNDGEVTIGDVSALIDILLSSEVDSSLLPRADVNHDGEITIGDVSALIDILLS